MFKTNAFDEDVVARRAGRVAFGVVLIAGAVTLAMKAKAIAQASTPWPPEGASEGVHAWQIIAGTWLAAVAAGVVVGGLASLLPRSRNSDSLRWAALAVPAVGLALILPLTLHLLVVAVELPQGGAKGSDLRELDEWCWFSVLYTSHTHVVFALMVLSRATALVRGEAPVSIKTIYSLTCLVAVVPAVIPAFVVALTGIPIIPLLHYMKRIAAKDREASRDIPYAVLRTA